MQEVSTYTLTGEVYKRTSIDVSGVRFYPTTCGKVLVHHGSRLLMTTWDEKLFYLNKYTHFLYLLPFNNIKVHKHKVCNV